MSRNVPKNETIFFVYEIFYFIKPINLYTTNDKNINMEKTTITLTPETRDRLKALGRKGESYDTLIQNLINNKKHNE